MAIHSNEVNQQSVPSDQPNWPELMSKTVGDLSHIAKTEIELLQANLRRLIESEANTIIGIFVLAIAALYGSVLVLSGLVVLLHIWLAWWLALLITGSATVSTGIAVKMAMTRARSL